MDFTLLEKESLINTISDIDIMGLTPLEAMNTLYKIVQEAKGLK